MLPLDYGASKPQQEYPAAKCTTEWEKTNRLCLVNVTPEGIDTFFHGQSCLEASGAPASFESSLLADSLGSLLGVLGFLFCSLAKKRSAAAALLKVKTAPDLLTTLLMLPHYFLFCPFSDLFPRHFLTRGR